MAWHFINEEFVNEPKISAFDLGLLRGYGIFDYIRIYGGKPFCLMEHIKRLVASAQQIDLQLPIDESKLCKVIDELIQKNDPIEAGIRILLMGGESKDHILPSDCASLAVLFEPFIPYPKKFYTEGMRAITTTCLRPYPSLKIMHYMPAVLAMKQAKKQGYDEGLYFHEKEGILEATRANIFFVRGNTIITPESEKIVKGITRSLFLKIAKKNFVIEKRLVFLEELKSFDEAFLTSSTKDAIPLIQINDQKIGKGKPGEVTKFLRTLFWHTFCDKSTALTYSGLNLK